MRCFYALKAESMAAVSVDTGNTVTVSAFIMEFVLLSHDTAVLMLLYNIYSINLQFQVTAQFFE